MGDYSHQTNSLIQEYLGIILIVCLFLLGIAIAYLTTLSSTLKEVSPANRKMQPSEVWLLLIPLFNLIWIYFIVIRISESIDNEYRYRNISDTSGTHAIGITYAILNSLIAFIYLFYPVSAGFYYILLFANFIFWISFWSSVSSCKSKLISKPISSAYQQNNNWNSRLPQTSNNNSNFQNSNNSQGGYSGGYSGGHNASNNNPLPANRAFPNSDSGYKSGDLYK